MSASDVAVSDFFNIPNALLRFMDPASVPASCSFDVHWSGPVTSSGSVTTPGSSGTLLMNNATMTWSARNGSGFSFVSDPAGTTSAFAEVGRVRNGIFNESHD